jgi:uncharacterized protein (TIGR03437 family)
MATASPEARMLINGVAAPIVYGSISQWNVIVPYEVEGAKTATIQAFVGGAASEIWTLPVTASTPGIFTANSSGTGPAAVLNQDGTINSPSNPAARGTMITFYATGEGQTLPEGVTGSVTGPSGPRPRLPVSVTIGFTEAAVQFAGAAPGLAAGVLQINALVPSTAFRGATPLRVKVGEVSSPEDVTVWIQ